MPVFNHHTNFPLQRPFLLEKKRDPIGRSDLLQFLSQDYFKMPLLNVPKTVDYKVMYTIDVPDTHPILERFLQRANKLFS